jgi:hypothetical protein
MSNTPETDANQIFLGFNPDEGDYFVPAKIARKLECERDDAIVEATNAVNDIIRVRYKLKEAEETAERYRLDANRFEAEVMILKEQIKELKDTLTVCTDNFSCKTFVPQKWELPPYDEQVKGTPIQS